MEKRIKALYTVTIIAILAFLVMQVYWLHGRYEFALSDYERNLSKRIIKCVDDYNTIRAKSSDSRIDSLNKKDNNTEVFSVPTFSLKHQYGDRVKTTRISKIYTYMFSAHKLLGLKPGTPLTENQKDRALELAQVQMAISVDSMVFDASGAKDESQAWIATSNVHTQRKSPFAVEGIDSFLQKSGIKAQINLMEADSMVWNTTVNYHTSVFTPHLSMVIPYSELQGMTVCIVSPINPFDILPGMWQTLVINLLVSCLLIVCLVLQFSTVLKLSRLDKMRNSFITTMIHELKRPISTLKMCISGLDNERMLNDMEIRKELLTETRNALDNLSAYFSKLRDITFNNVEQIPLNIHSINLHDLFDTVARATVQPSGKSLIINNMIDYKIIVSADRSHLYNILNNLVENAVKYSGKEVEINASATEREGFIEFMVSDNGNGIPSGDLTHIFQRFYRGNASAGEQPGMGLGLAYVKLLVEAHGGVISVESSEGHGTCFTIKLPQ